MVVSVVATVCLARTVRWPGTIVQIIELRLNGVEEMFVLAPTDLFSEYRNYLTGVEFCISVLRARHTRGR